MVIRSVLLTALLFLVACPDPNPNPQTETHNPWLDVSKGVSSAPGRSTASPPAANTEVTANADCAKEGPLQTWDCLTLPAGLPPMAAKWKGPVKGFATLCASCHGADGHGASMGQQLGVKDLTSEEIQKKSDAEIAAIIKNGSSNNKMPAFAESLSDALINDLVGHIRTLPNKKLDLPF